MPFGAQHRAADDPAARYFYFRQSPLQAAPLQSHGHQLLPAALPGAEAPGIPAVFLKARARVEGKGPGVVRHRLQLQLGVARRPGALDGCPGPTRPDPR